MMCVSSPCCLAFSGPPLFILVAVSSIALHNAAASPALSISVYAATNLFVAQSHTRDRIEYVQDTEPLHTISTSTSSTNAKTALSVEPTVPSLLLKIPIEEGSRWSFGLKGYIPESIMSPSQLHTDAQDHSEDIKDCANKDGAGTEQQPPIQSSAPLAAQGPLATTAQPSDVTLAVTMTTADEGFGKVNSSGSNGNSRHPLSRDNSLGPDCHTGPWSSKTSLVTCATESSAYSVASPSLFFVEVHTEAELQDVCRGPDFDRQMKERNIVDVQPGLQEQGNDPHTFTWTWEYPSRGRVEDDGRKTIFAFLYRNSSGDVEVLSQFSLWVIASHHMDHPGGYRRPIHRLSPSTGKGHWRRASTPERFGRPPSYPGKGSNLSGQNSLQRFTEVTGSTSGTSATTDAAPPNSSSSASANNTLIDTEDGPVFRATVVECENHIREMKASTKRIIKAAQTVMEARKELAEADEAFVKELEGFKPAEQLVKNYLQPMSTFLAQTSEDLDLQMKTLLIEPLTRFYTNDIKIAETKKKTFDDESKEYYQYLSRYMAIKHESTKKKSEADTKYERKRRQFEKGRFEYWSFLQDMRVGGSKSDEMLHLLTNYSEKQYKNMLEMASLAEELKPSLDVITAELIESHRRTIAVWKEREERRKEAYDDVSSSSIHPPTKSAINLAVASSPPSYTDAAPEANLDPNSGAHLSADEYNDSNISAETRSLPGYTAGAASSNGSSQYSSVPKFSGIRDLEHQDIDANSALGSRREGFLFATSRPNMHNNTVVLEKPSINWHKYWCVVSDGYLHEYSNWKKGVTMLHNEPINLKISTVRPCRNQDRRFCFEVITPKYRRVYQATSTEDMNSWVSVISNAIQGLLDGTSPCQGMGSELGGVPGVGNLIASMSGNNRNSMDQPSPLPLDRQLGAPSNGSPDLSSEASDTDHLGTRLLKVMREAHPANNFCAECGAKNPDWCAINLGILICIECSGIHRSLGTHISKVRSFTLDTTSYTRDLFDFIRAVGNDVSNGIWEATLGSDHPDKVTFRKPVSNDKREYKVSFIQKKYVERAFVDRQKFSEAADAAEMSILATKALFQAANANSIPDVIGAFAVGADLNAVQEAEADNEGSDSNGDLDSQPEQQMLSPQQEVLSPTSADAGGSSYMVMQTSPLLLALRHGVPFSLDDQHEVYPMAEFMIQNGATSNISVEVRLIEEDSEGPGQAATEAPSIAQQSAVLLSAEGDHNWESTHVDPEDIRNHQLRSNRRSLGEVVHMRGEGGATAMEYLRAKSAARGETMLGSPPAVGYGDYSSLSGSPPSFSARYASMTALNSPPSASSGGGVYSSSTLSRQHSTSSYHDITSLFKRRESDGGGPSSSGFGSGKGSEGDVKSGSNKPYNSGLAALSASSHNLLSTSQSMGHKMKNTLTKSLRLPAQYIKGNMSKDKDYSVPIITQTIFSTSPPSSKTADAPPPAASASSHAPPTSEAMPANPDMSHQDSSLSGPYILLHRKGSINSGTAPNSGTMP
ncbi:hypothetical protein BGX31_005033 [Mortierella sp. GBA43]|nr:hypothetical protein BGX31_005033 [Mortierella sp. GBA43]